MNGGLIAWMKALPGSSPSGRVNVNCCEFTMVSGMLVRHR